MLKKINAISITNVRILKNMFGAFFVKGASLVVSLILLPLYINFFNDKTTLGLWYTILSVLNWVTLFDLGLGHGLRNKLPVAIENKDTGQISTLISTTYGLMMIIASIVLVVGEIGIGRVDWNIIFNIEDSIVSNSVLIECVRLVFGGVIINIVLKIITSILYAIQYSAVVNFLALIPNIIILGFLCIIPSNSLETNLKTISIINICAINLPYIICTWIVFGHILKNNIPSLKFFKTDCIKEIFSIGVSLLWLQVVFMVISSANELIISNLTSSDYVVEYQIYYKIFKTGGMIVSLSLTPIWSAVTKAQAQENFRWIKKTYMIFLLAAVICVLVELCIVPILPWIVTIWIGKNTIEINNGYALVFVFSSAMTVLHSVNTAIGNGLSYFKVQMIWMSLAAFAFLPVSCFFVHIMGSWIGVVAANTVVLIPYEFLAPIFTIRLLNKKATEVKE